MHTLATRFGRGHLAISSRTPLEDAQLRAVCPSIFADDAHESRSSRYVYVPTIKLVDGLRREGWQPFFAAQSRSRDAGQIGHTKHMLRLRRVGDINAQEAAEVVIVNSHNGSSSYQMFAGLIRFVCTNSLIAGSKFEEVRVPHKGNIQDQIIEGAYTVAQDFPRLIDAAAEMKALRLSPPEQGAFARAALVARYGEDQPPVTAAQLLRPRRREDAGPGLWETLNVVQENIIRGGLIGRKQDERGRIRRASTRAINGIDQNVGLNRALWTLAQEMQAIKATA
ncbi:MAG: DUF945 domain-containing protein [Sandarakinorhabdus sp.]|jgi:hypothetical protein|nr:DUF945 domain-containing protein [Sandarakinorhabdus sp.]